MNIITCYKLVPDEQDIVVKADRTLSFDKAAWKIGLYDLPAIEAGMQIVEKVGGKVVALSTGTTKLENSKLKKAILSRGPDEAYLVMDDSLANADTHQTARILAEAIIKIGSFDLVICGEGSSDLYAQQVGSQLGELLNVASINGINKITPAEGKIVVERVLENEVEVLEITLPAVISVTTDINLPRIPSMKDILAGGKKTVNQWSLADISIKDNNQVTEIISTLAPQQADRKLIITKGDSEEAICQFFEIIRKELF